MEPTKEFYLFCLVTCYLYIYI